jgi:SAM-dependent methyltransferase
MRPDIPDMSRRAQPAELPELMDGPCSRDDLRACLRDIGRLNQWLLGYRPTFKWLDQFAGSRTPLRILDIGCGDGEALRKIARWAQKRRIEVRLTGLDLNPETIGIAKEMSANCPIEFVCANIFAYEPEESFDLIVSSLFAHHLGDEELARVIRWMEHNARQGWFVNDLSRAEIPYHLLRLLTKVTRLHRLVQHDGPVSIARAFRPDDWRRLCVAAGLEERDFSILSYTPGRLCVARVKLP